MELEAADKLLRYILRAKERSLVEAMLGTKFVWELLKDAAKLHLDTCTACSRQLWGDCTNGGGLLYWAYIMYLDFRITSTEVRATSRKLKSIWR